MVANLRYAADQFKKDREIFLEAIKTDVNMLMPTTTLMVVFSEMTKK